jgi:hypothetical protein
MARASARAMNKRTRRQVGVQDTWTDRSYNLGINLGSTVRDTTPSEMTIGGTADVFLSQMLGPMSELRIYRV